MMKSANCSLEFLRRISRRRRSAPNGVEEADIDWSRRAGMAELKVTTAQGGSLEETLKSESRSAATGHMLRTLWSGPTKVISEPGAIDIVGHRVVHGGREYEQSTFVTNEVRAAIDRLRELALAHNPANLEGIVAIEQIFGAVRQVAVFDTPFTLRSQKQLPFIPVPTNG
jgi:acetate kinase